MTIQYADLFTVSGQALTAKVFPEGSDTEVTGNTLSVVERTNDKGTYRVSIDRASVLAAGTYKVTLFSGTTPFATGLRIFRGVDTEVAATTDGTILNRLGAWTGSGVNTILGALRAAMNKAATAPSDIGGTFDPATDSTEAIRDRGDAAWVTGTSGTGTGARTVTITVNDGTTALQNARVRLTEGTNTYTGLTNASGVVTFNLDDATYVVSITKSGYSFAGTTLVVDGTETVTYSMTVVSVTPPDDPALCAVTIHLRNQYGVDLQGEPVEITWVKWDTGANETPPVLSVPPVQMTNATGVVEVNLYREAVYKIVYGNAPYTRRIDLAIPDAGAYAVEV